MNIPKRFRLFVQTNEIEFVDNLVDTDDSLGLAKYRQNKITLQKSTSSVFRPDSQIEKTFCHELVHWIFYMLHEDELRKNEKLAELTGNCLHQTLETMEYEQK